MRRRMECKAPGCATRGLVVDVETETCIACGGSLTPAVPDFARLLGRDPMTIVADLFGGPS